MNSEMPEIKRYVIDRDRLPALFPTDRHPAQIWEHLGRAVATFGFLEEVLGKAIFAFTATLRYNSIEDAEVAYEKWLPQLQRALTDQLWSLADQYRKVVRSNPDSNFANVDDLVHDIKEATKLRNVLCHGSWRTPDSEGKSLLLFFNKNNEKFETPIDIDFLRTVQHHVAQLSCSVIDSVTHMGWQFPGGAGPGKMVWPRT